jgi:hypothetical protein
MIKYFFLAIITLAFFSLNACQSPAPKPALLSDEEYLHRAEKKLTDIIITDIFTPPVASRVYVYPLLAAHEAGRFNNQNTTSLCAILKGFEPMPNPTAGQKYDFVVAAIKAFCTTAKKVIFSVKEIEAFEKETLAALKTRCSEEEFNRSVAFGEQVAAVVIKRLASDNYKETRGMERFVVNPKIIGRWQPTPPDYADGVEPHWAKMKPLLMDSSGQIRAAVAAPYSEKPTSAFWKETVEVQQLSKTLTEEQEEIVRFWDDNPFVSRHKGHLMFQDKKMTPGGHWLAICQTACKEKNTDFYTTLHAYALTSVTIYEAFISCWHEKYKSARQRPETVISAKLEKEWHPYLVTPPFPAYTSGHSTISAAAAETLTVLFGDNYAFTDETEKEYGLPVRSFKSFRAAAKEASISRLYAGIHYRSDCDAGNAAGIKIGALLNGN